MFYRRGYATCAGAIKGQGHQLQLEADWLIPLSLTDSKHIIG